MSSRGLPELALRIAATDLQRDFSQTFDVETIERIFNACYAELAAHATVANFLPLFAERSARQRLNALARIEDTGPASRARMSA